MAPYRPPGRSNRSGRAQNNDDVFEGLPVKQWTHASTRVSLAPPFSEVQGQQGPDRWGEPPMPRDWQLLQPWTQQLLRLARSGRLGQKRKPTRDADDVDGEDYGAREDDAHGGDEQNALSKSNMLGEDRAFVAKKWRHVPDHALVPEHLHMEFLARSRKGMPSFYHNLNSDGYGVAIPTRKTKVSKVIDAATGEVAVYEIIVPEGQPLENEVTEDSEYASKEPTVLTIGTFIEGLGTANLEGVLVADVRSATVAAQRRNRPPPKKKGGPGRGKKRVTFTNPDGSTYTTIVPNATKIVPQPGQTVKHVAKGEEAARDITAEEAASMKAAEMGHDGEGEDDGDDDEEGDDDGEEGNDREEGELIEDTTEIQTDADTKPSTPQAEVFETIKVDEPEPITEEIIIEQAPEPSLPEPEAIAPETVAPLAAIEEGDAQMIDAVPVTVLEEVLVADTELSADAPILPEAGEILEAGSEPAQPTE